MADDNIDTQPQPPQPNPDLKKLDRLVGTWNVAGGAQGQVSVLRGTTLPTRTAAMPP